MCQNYKIRNQTRLLEKRRKLKKEDKRKKKIMSSSMFATFYFIDTVSTVNNFYRHVK